MFLLSAEHNDGAYKTVYALFSQLQLEGSYNDVCALFSEITFAEGATVRGKVWSLSSIVRYVSGDGISVEGFLGGLFAEEGITDGFMYREDTVPAYILRAALTLLGAALCLAALASFNGFIEQGSMLLTSEPGRVMRNGLVAYALTLAMILICAMSVILLPIAALLAVVMLVMIISGQASLSALIGLIAARRAGKKFSAAACLTLGLAPMAFVTSIPYISIPVYYIFVPILSMGITVTGLINGLIKKKFYYAPFKRRDLPPPAYDRTGAKRRILGLDGEDGH